MSSSKLVARLLLASFVIVVLGLLSWPWLKNHQPFFRQMESSAAVLGSQDASDKTYRLCGWFDQYGRVDETSVEGLPQESAPVKTLFSGVDIVGWSYGAHRNAMGTKYFSGEMKIDESAPDGDYVFKVCLEHEEPSATFNAPLTASDFTLRITEVGPRFLMYEVLSLQRDVRLQVRYMVEVYKLEENASDS